MRPPCSGNPSTAHAPSLNHTDTPPHPSPHYRLHTFLHAAVDTTATSHRSRDQHKEYHRTSSWLNITFTFVALAGETCDCALKLSFCCKSLTDIMRSINAHRCESCLKLRDRSMSIHHSLVNPTNRTRNAWTCPAAVSAA